MTVPEIVARSNGPARRVASRFRRMAAPLIALVGYDFALRPWMRNWGSSPEERDMRLPGDDVISDVMTHYTKGITIEAPPERVWPWLVQIGDRRAGFYSYDWIERFLFPGMVHYSDGRHSANRIHPELQNVHIGDPINTGSLGKMAFGNPVTVMEPDHALVIGTWAFILHQLPAGATRLLVRDRDGGYLQLLVPRRFSTLRLALGIIDYLVGDPLHFLMERKMMLGLKERIETNVLGRTATEGSRSTRDNRGE